MLLHIVEQATERMDNDMSYDDRFTAAPPPHNLIVESRSRTTVSGVVDVESFDENEIIMATTMGVIFLRGTGLRIERLSLDTGDVAIEGNVNRVEYEDTVREQGGGFFGRLFK